MFLFIIFGVTVGKGPIFLTAKKETSCEHLISCAAWGMEPTRRRILEEQELDCCWTIHQAVFLPSGVRKLRVRSEVRESARHFGEREEEEQRCLR